MLRRCGVVGSLLLLLSNMAYGGWHNGASDIMGTRVSVELWHEDPAVAAAAIASVMAEMHAVDESMSPYISTSELYKVNQLAAQQAVAISPALYAVIEKALYFSGVSDSAFDISFSSLGRFYDYRSGQAPAGDQVDHYLPAINYQLIELDKQHQTVRFHHPELKIDLGGIAKGHAVDRAITLLTNSGIESAIVSAGGDSRILGDRRGTPWVIGIRHPRKDTDFAVRIPLQNTAVSTSGDYERFFLKDGERVHHIINPATGKSAAKVQSVTVLAPLAVDSDALSTTVFVLGVSKGLALVNKLKGVDAIIIDAQGHLHYSDELLRAAKN